MKKKDTALVIVDVQPEFIPEKTAAAPGRRAYKNIQLLFQSARKKGIPIITLEYADCGTTPDELRVRSRLYCTKTKYKNDGSEQVLEACEDMNIRPEKLVFCGHNYDACVLQTIQGLRPTSINTQVIVVKEATNFYWEEADERFNNREGTILRDYLKMKHVSHHDMYPNSRFPAGCWCKQRSCPDWK